MRKEFVVQSVVVSPDGESFVVVSLTSAKDAKEPHKPQFDPSKMNLSDMNSMMKDLNKMLSGMDGGGSTSLKMELYEYKKMDLSVGDKVYLELTKDEDTGL